MRLSLTRLLVGLGGWCTDPAEDRLAQCRTLGGFRVGEQFELVVGQEITAGGGSVSAMRLVVHPNIAARPPQYRVDVAVEFHRVRAGRADGNISYQLIKRHDVL